MSKIIYQFSGEKDLLSYRERRVIFIDGSQSQSLEGGKEAKKGSHEEQERLRKEREKRKKELNQKADRLLSGVNITEEGPNFNDTTLDHNSLKELYEKDQQEPLLTPKNRNIVNAYFDFIEGKKNVTGVFDMLQKVENVKKKKLEESEYVVLLKVSPWLIAKKFPSGSSRNKEILNRYVRWLVNMPKKVQRGLPDFIDAYFCEELFRLFPKPANQSLSELYTWNHSRTTGDVVVVSEREANEAVNAGGRLHDLRDEKTEEDLKMGNDKKRQVGDRVEKMLDVIQSSGLSYEIQQKAKQSALQEQRLIDSFDKIDVNQKVREIQQQLFATVRAEIESEISSALQSGAENILDRVSEIEDTLRGFFDASKNFAVENSAFSNKQAVEEFLDRKFESSLNRVRSLCDKVANEQYSEEGVLDNLSGLDLHDEGETNSAHKNRYLISSVLKYADWIDQSTPEVQESVHRQRDILFDKTRSKQESEEEISKRQYEDEALEILNDEEFGEKYGIEPHVVWQIFEDGDLPEYRAFGKVREFAEKWNISESDAEQIIRNPVPVLRSTYVGKEDFVRKALEETGEISEEHIDQVVEYAKKPGSAFQRFVDANGSMRQMLLRDASDQLIEVGDWVMGSFEDMQEEKSFIDEVIHNADTPPETDEEVERAVDSYLQEKINTAKNQNERVRESVGSSNFEKIEQLQRSIDDIQNGLEEHKRSFQSETPEVQEAERTRVERSSAELHRVKRLLKDVSKISTVNPSQALKDDGGRAALARDLEAFTGKSVNLLENSSPEEIQQKVFSALDFVEDKISYLNRLKDNPDEIVSLLSASAYSGGSDKQKKSNEQQMQRNDLEIQSQTSFQEFSDWLLSSLNKSTDIHEIKEIVSNLRNRNGSTVLQILDDNEFEKKHGTDHAAVAQFKGKGFKIFVPRSKWENPEGTDLLTSLQHEGWHAIDFADDFHLSQEFHTIAKKINGFEDVKRDLIQNRGVSASDFAKELLAYYLSGELDGTAFATSVKESFPINSNPQNKSRFFQILEEASQNFVDRGIKKGIFSGTDTLYRSYATTPQELGLNPNNPNRYNAEFVSKRDRILQKIEGIQKTKHSRISGEDQALAQANENLRYLDELMINGFQDDSKIEPEVLDKMDTLDSQVSAVLGEKVERQIPGRGYFGELWYNTTFLSLADLGNMWETTVEMTKRRHDRGSKSRSGKAGKALFGDTVLGNEFDNKAEEAEKEEVGNYEKGLDNKSPWQIMDRVSETTNEDELKACLNKLAENGNIDWNDRRLWRALERVGSGVNFIESDANDPNILAQKLQRACDRLWDNDMYRETVRKNTGSYKSGMESWEEEADSNISILGPIIESMLSQKRNGVNVDPQRFEMYIKHCIVKGKSTPEEVFWYILQGVRHGLLTMGRVNKYDAEFLNEFPPTQWFYKNKPTSEQIMRMAKMYEPTSGGGMPKPFLDWFYVNVMTNDKVLDRVIKSSADGKWDHDWAQNMLSTGTYSSVKGLLTLYHGKPQIQVTAFPNGAVGQSIFMTNLAKNRNELTKEKLQETIARQAELTTFFSTSVLGKYNEGNLFRLGAGDRARPPRIESHYAGRDAGKSKSSGEYLEDNLSMFMELSPAFKRLFSQHTIHDNDVKVFYQDIQSAYPGKNIFEYEPRNMDDLFSNMAGIVKKILEADPKAMDRVLAKANAVYAKDHPTEDSRGNINYELAGGNPYAEYYPDKTKGVYGLE